MALTAAAFLLCALPLVAAHGDEHSGNAHGENDLNLHKAPKPPSPDNDAPESYWSLTEHAGLMYMHIATEILAWFIVLPVGRSPSANTSPPTKPTQRSQNVKPSKLTIRSVGIMFSIARSHYALPTQLLFLATNALALLLGVLYTKATPDLYPNNSHSKTGWTVTWIASAWVAMALIQVYAGRTNTRSFSEDDEAAQPMTAANMAHYERVYDEQLPDPGRFSVDSGQGTSTLCGHSRSPSVESEGQKFGGAARRYSDGEEEGFEPTEEKRGYFHNSRLDKFCARYLSRFATGRPLGLLRFFYVVLDRTLLVQGFVAFTTGTVVYGGIAVSPHPPTISQAIKEITKLTPPSAAAPSSTS